MGIIIITLGLSKLHICSFLLLLLYLSGTVLQSTRAVDHPHNAQGKESPFPVRPITETVQQEKRMLMNGDYHKNGNAKLIVGLRKRIGSRPPLCKDKCNTCFPCEAVQVPSPIASKSSSLNYKTSSLAHLDYSNYQPEGWKCKCGTRIFNP